ncbi:MAG TPA: hypothetical protein GX745_08125 [Clostridiales bacterium]|nr:hypothetical protein [Clostridiales bacterium]
MSNLKTEELVLVDEKSFDDKGGSVLGVLEGPVADFMHSTRNGRFYSERLWEKAFKDPIILEMFENGGIPGELDHPRDDREDIDSEKICVIMSEPPKKSRDSQGKLIGRFEILNTPCGKIVHTLAKAGLKLGVSSRGTGEVDDYTNEVIPESYDFKCFDIVILPSVQGARLNLITESLDQNKKQTLKEELQKIYLEEDEQGKRIFVEAIEGLNMQKILHGKPLVAAAEEVRQAARKGRKPRKRIKKEDLNNNKESLFLAGLNEKLESENKSQKEGAGAAVDNIEASEIITQLQEALLTNVNLNKQLFEAQKERAVSNAKAEELDAKLNEQVNAYAKLQEQFELEKDQAVKKFGKKLELYESTIKKLKDDVAALGKQLGEKTLSEKKLKEDLEKSFTVSNQKLLEAKKNSDNIQKQCDSYKKLAHSIAERYIDSKASALGITSIEIKNRLNESYTIDDVDNVCRTLRNQSVSINKLPFALDNPAGARVKLREDRSRDPLKNVNKVVGQVDDFLLDLAGLKK